MSAVRLQWCDIIMADSSHTLDVEYRSKYLNTQNRSAAGAIWMSHHAGIHRNRISVLKLEQVCALF